MRAYLQQTEDFMVDLPISGQGVHTMAGLILKYGVMMSGSPRPADVPKEEKQMCFGNALHLALKRNWLYVEGYAESVMPLQHAWCIDDEGRVVDPTWEDAEDRAYLGIPMDPQFVVRLVCEQNYYGVLGLDYHMVIDHGFVTDVCERTGLTIAIDLGEAA